MIPVYKVHFNTDDNLEVYVHTETNALAAMNNDWKKNLQSIFQLFHTWSWLDDYPLTRILIITILMASLLSMLFSGLYMLIAIKRSQYKSTSQRIHRRLAWVIFIPFFGFLFSGIYHLYQSEFGENVRGMRLGNPLSISHENQKTIDLNGMSGVKLNSLSLVAYGDKPFIRASLAKKEPVIANANAHDHDHDHHQHEQRNKRYDGISKEKSAIYFPLTGINHDILDDKTLVKTLASNYLGLPDNTVIELSKITHFGPVYDFRNKRLPVWKVAFNTPKGDKLFIDPITGILVDHVIDQQRFEGLSFSMLHKWNFMLAFTERHIRDIFIVIMMLSVFALGTFGLILKIKNTRDKYH